MPTLALDYRLPGVDWLFSVPSGNPLQNPGPLVPVFEQLLGELRARRLPKALQLTLHLPASECAAGIVVALHDGWKRVVNSRLQEQQLRLQELRLTRRRFLLKGLTVLASCLALGAWLGEADSGFERTLAESLIIGGWVAVWVPLERILYSGWPLTKEQAILRCLLGCDLRIVADKPVF
ncbi:MAG: hypothetical protein A2Y50_11215 [Pseudomonadales bacterium RIFCSPLOWO2_12_59_9]|nr:MAG: hypothetical protein A2Y50_11215 [Pseudomonadales bacterium RIFCSPLOWO2_12_59_9]